MRKPLITATVAYLLGMILAKLSGYFPLTLILLGSIGVIAWIMGRRGKKEIIWGLFVATLFLAGTMNLFRASPSYPPDDLSHLAGTGIVTVRGQIDSPLAHRPARSHEETESTVLSINSETVYLKGREEKTSGRIRLTVIRFHPELEYGDWVEVKVRLRPLTGLRNPGGFDYVRYMERQGFRARATLTRPEDIKRLEPGGNRLLKPIYRWREKIRLAMLRSLSLEASAILQAVIIGETGYLTPEIRDPFMVAGAAHILSISGSHLSFVAFAVFGLTLMAIRCFPARWLLPMGRNLSPAQWGVLLTVPPVVFYALLAGGKIATIRALIMILVYLGAVWLMRPHDGINAIAFAALIVTGLDPNAIFNISFQLSYGAVFAIALCIQKWKIVSRRTPTSSRLRHTVWSKINMLLLLTAAAGVGTAPLVAYHFNQFSWVGFLANLVVTPLVGILVVPAGLISAVGVILTDHSLFPFAGLHNGMIRFLIQVTEFFARIPAAEIHVPSPPIAVIVLWYAAAGVFLFGRGSLRKRVMLGLVCVGLTLPWIITLSGVFPSDEIRVSFLDVGQGDAALIEFPTGHTLLVDGGNSRGRFDVGRLVLAPFLWDRSIGKIDYLVMTHPQADHAGGLTTIVKKFRVGEIWTNGIRKEADFYKKFIQAAHRRHIPVKIVNADTMPLALGKSSIEILHPGRNWTALKENDRSIVIRVRHGRSTFLFTGDIEAPAERQLIQRITRLKTSVIKVPHHGSRSSIEPTFLLRVNPDYALISVGRGNYYGHPAPETLAGYQLLGSQVYRTDRDGAVTFVSDGNQIKLFVYNDVMLSVVSWGEGMFREEWENWKKWVITFSGFRITSIGG